MDTMQYDGPYYAAAALLHTVVVDDPMQQQAKNRLGDALILLSVDISYFCQHWAYGTLYVFAVI